MSSVYEHAYLWEKGRSSLHSYALAMESVTAGAGEVFFGFVSDSDKLARRAVLWFFEDALPIIRDFGICHYLRSSYERKVGKKMEGNYCLVLCLGRRKVILSRGDQFEILTLNKGAVFVCNKALADILGKERMISLMNETVTRKTSFEEDSDRLHEFGRRALSRGLEDSMAAFFVCRRKKGLRIWKKR